MTGKAKKRSLKEKFARRSFAYPYAEGLVRSKLADQFRHLRGDTSQGEFARVIGTQQSKISERYENPDYGKHNLSKLFNIARRLGLMLDIELKSAHTFFHDNHDTTRDWFDLPPFEEAVKKLNMPAVELLGVRGAILNSGRVLQEEPKSTSREKANVIPIHEPVSSFASGGAPTPIKGVGA